MALVTKTLPDMFDFTRASGGGYFDSTGKYVWDANSNTPRLTYDPLLFTRKGVLVEGQKTNITTGAINPAYYSQAAVSLTPNSAVAPDGTVSAAKVERTSSASTGYINHQVGGTTVIGESYTVSAFVKQGVGATIRFGVSGQGGGLISFNLTSFAFSGPAGGAIGSYTRYSNGWIRVSLKYSETSSTNRKVYLEPTQTFGSYVFVWGAQMEKGDLTSYAKVPVTFVSRSSTATYFDQNGVLQTAAAGIARNGYSYVNGAWVAQGLVIEGLRTNRLLRSQDFSTVWSLTNCTQTVSGTAPDGTPSMGMITTTTSADSIQQTFPVTSGASYTLSFYLKAGSSSTVAIALLDTGGAFPATRVDFDLTLGSAVVAVGTPASFGITPVGGGIYRCWVAALATATATAHVSVESRSLDEVSTYYVWGAQSEEGYIPTSYIPTTTAQVTRSADVTTSSAITRSADSLLLADAITVDPVWSREIGTWIVKITDAAALKNILVFNGYGVISDVTGSGSVVLVKKSRYEGDVYVDGIYAYTLTQYHNIDLNALTDAIVAEGGSGGGCISRVRFFPRIMSPAEIADIGVA